MGSRKRRGAIGGRHRPPVSTVATGATQVLIAPPEPASPERLPDSHQALSDYYGRFEKARPWDMRVETLRRIERYTGRPVLCYVAKTTNLQPGVPAHIDNSDVDAFADLTGAVSGDAVDVFLASNGGSPEAAERIVRMLRGRFKQVRFIVAGNAYSAATMICFSGDEIVMDSMATLGPVDPQINGVPARAILRAFETLEKRLATEGPRALTAYMPLLSKYDLHLLEICRSAQELSRELTTDWLRTYMLKGEASEEQIKAIVDHFLDYDVHKSHGRSIDRVRARELRLRVLDVEEWKEAAYLVRSLHHQYEFFFEKTGFYKVFENAHGINWGRQVQEVTFQVPLSAPPGMPPVPVPQPGPPRPSG